MFLLWDLSYLDLYGFFFNVKVGVLPPHRQTFYIELNLKEDLKEREKKQLVLGVRCLAQDEKKPLIRYPYANTSSKIITKLASYKTERVATPHIFINLHRKYIYTLAR